MGENRQSVFHPSHLLNPCAILMGWKAVSGKKWHILKIFFYAIRTKRYLSPRMGSHLPMPAFWAIFAQNAGLSEL
jgi:hypothetical protein